MSDLSELKKRVDSAVEQLSTAQEARRGQHDKLVQLLADLEVKFDARHEELSNGLEEGWRLQTIELSGEALAMRIEAIACYQSQLSTFFRDRQDLARQVSHYVQGVGGEQVWRQIGL